MGMAALWILANVIATSVTTTTTFRPTGYGRMIHQTMTRSYSVVEVGSGRSRLSINVARRTAFQSSAQILLEAPLSVFRGQLEVVFSDEPSSGPGVVRDWFSEMSRQVMQPETGLFISSPDSPYYAMINPLSDVSARSNEFRAVGRFLGLAYHQRVELGVQFPIQYYAKLLEVQITLQDIQSDEPALYRSLSYLLTAPESELPDMPMTVDNEVVIPTIHNRENLVHLKVNSLIPDSVSHHFRLLRDAFVEIISLDPREYEGLTPAGLNLRIEGMSFVDVEDLIANLRSETRISPLLPPVLRSFSQNELRRFLRFVTGSSQVPAGGFRVAPITIYMSASMSQLPRAGTCSRSLSLPPFIPEAQLRDRLLFAMRNCEGFH